MQLQMPQMPQMQQLQPQLAHVNTQLQPQYQMQHFNQQPMAQTSQQHTRQYGQSPQQSSFQPSQYNQMNTTPIRFNGHHGHQINTVSNATKSKSLADPNNSVTLREFENRRADNGQQFCHKCCQYGHTSFDCDYYPVCLRCKELTGNGNTRHSTRFHDKEMQSANNNSFQPQATQGSFQAAPFQQQQHHQQHTVIWE